MAIDWNKAMSSSESNKKKKSEIDWEKAGAYSKEKLDSFSRYGKKTTTSKPTTNVPKNESYKPKQSSGVENKYSKIQPENKTKTEKSVQTYQKQPYANANKRATGYVDMKADEHLASVGSKTESMTDSEREKFLAEYISKPNKDMSASDVVLKQNQAKSKKAWDEEKAEYKATRKQGATDKTTEYKDKFYDMNYEERKLIGLGDEESLDTLKSEYGYTDDDITAMTYFYNRHVNKKKARQEEINAKVNMEQHPFLESVASVPMGLAGGVGSLLGIADSYIDNKRVEKLGIEDQGLDYNHQLGSWQRQAQAGRQEFMDTHDLMVGDYDLGDMLYSTAMSGLESATAAVIPGGAVLLGVNAGTSKANELAQRGLSSDKALVGGIVSGAFESIFENWSIGKFKKLQEVPVSTIKDVVLNIGKSMLTNFEEEAATELANIIYDSIAHGDKSEYQIEVKKLVDSGEFTEKEAQKEVLLGQVLQIVEAGASGALMGAGFGAAGSGIAYESDYRARQSIGQEIKQSGTESEIIEEARQSKDKAVQEWVQRIDKKSKGKEVKDADLGGTFRAMLEADEKAQSEETKTEDVVVTPEEKVEIASPTLEKTDKGVVSVASVESVKDGNITVKDTEGNNRTLDINTLEGKSKALWTYASEHFTDGKVVENFVKSYEGGDVDTYSRLYKGVFDLASVGMSAEKIVSENFFEHRVLGEKAFASAVESGHVAMSYKSGVVDLTTERKTNSQKLTMKVADSFGKRHGINIVFVDTLGTREGFYKSNPKQIVIALDSSSGAISRTLGHETYHYIETADPEKAKQISDFVVDTMTRIKGAEWVEERLAFYESQGYATREEQISDFVADQMFEVFANERAVNEFVKQDRTFAQKVVDHIKGLISEIKAIYKKLVSSGRYEDIAAWQEDLDALEQVNNMMLDALNSIENNLNAQEQQMVDAMGEDVKEIEINEDGEVTLIRNEDDSVIVSSYVTWDNGGRADLEKALKRNGYNASEVAETVDTMETIADFLKDMAKSYADTHGYTLLGEHLTTDVTMDVKNGKMVLHSIVNNGDYPVNIDLALNCKKRVAYMRVMRDLINNGVFESVKYDGDAIAKVNEILRKNGFETACLGCFVESRRLQFQAWAETIVQEWNNAVETDNKNAGYFGYAKVQKGASSLTDQELIALDNLLSKYEKNDQGNVKLGQGSVATRMKRLIKKSEHLQKKITVADLLTPEGLTNLRRENPNLFSLVKSRYGAASPKIVQDYNPYSGEMSNLTFARVKDITHNSIKGSSEYIAEAEKQLADSKPEQPKKVNVTEYKKSKEYVKWDEKVQTLAMRNYLYDIGGARMQSFSDFMIENVFDYVQIVADLSANKFPMHTYTKEIVMMRLFGMSGIKMNGSLIAHVDKTLDKKYAGLLPVSEADKGNAIRVNTSEGEFAIGFDDYSRYSSTKGTDSETFIQSIGYKDIIALQLDTRYSPYVGNIAIGVSDLQIEAMLDSPLFRMVIPYHASGMLPQFAKLVGVNKYNDYTNYQNTTVKQCYDKNGNPVGRFKKGKKDLAVDTSYPYNAELQKVKDPKVAANNYLAWCDEMHPVYDGKTFVGYATFSPKFSNSPYGTDFTKHENYYKLLEDFDVYDSVSGGYAEQGAVSMTFPSADNRLSETEKAEYRKRLEESGVFTAEEIDKYVAKADMTFEEIIKAELDNRSFYESTQSKKYESTLNEISDALVKEYSRSGQISSYKEFAKTLKDGTEKQKEEQKGKFPLKGTYDITADEDEIRWSKKRVEHLTESDAVEIFESCQNGEYKRNSYVPVSKTTPSIVIEKAKRLVKLNPYPLFMKVEKVQQMIENEDVQDGGSRFHGVDPETATQIFKKIFNPNYIFYQKDNRRITVIVRLGKSKNAFVTLDKGRHFNPELLNGYEGGIYNVSVTVYYLDNLKKYIGNENNVLLYDKSKANHEEVSGSLVPSLSNDSPYFENIVSQNQEDVNTRFSTKRKSLLSEDAINYIQDTEEFQEIISIVDERYNLTNRKMLSPQAIERFAGSILSKAHSKYDKGLLIERLTALFDYMANSSELEWNDIMSVTAEIANDILAESKRLDRTMSEEYKDTLKYLKGLTIYINPSVRAEIESRYGDIENYRRALGGRTHITVKDSNAYHLDSLWRELSEDRPEMFDADLNALEQAEALANFFDMTKSTLSNPYGMYMEEAAYDFALQIYDEYFEIPEVKSEARRYALREERLKGKYGAKIKEIRKSYEERMSNIRKLYKDKLNKVKAEDREKYEKLRSDKNARIEQTKLLYQERNREYREKRNETAEKQKLRAQIVRQSKMLVDKLVNPTETKHIPQELIKGVNDFSRAITNGGVFPLKRAVDLTEAFDRIDEKGEDPNFFVSSMYDEEIKQMLKALTTTLADKRLSDMTVDELLTIRNISRYFNHIVKEANETFATDKKMKLSELQDKALAEFESQDRDKKRMANEFQTNLLKPSVFFELLDSSTLNMLYQNIQKGGFGYARTIFEDREKFDSLKEKYDYESWSDDIVELETERGQKIKINVPTALSIYATAKRKQGVDHITIGGIVLEEDAIKKVDKQNLFKSSKKTDNTVNVKGDNIPMTVTDVQNLFSKLTDEQKNCADEVVSYLSNEKSKLGNEISMALFGYKRFNESYYFPIKSAPDFLYTKPGVEIDSRIKHMSMTKSTVPKANNPVVIGDFFDTAMGHCSNMALYYNLTLPLEDFNRVFNYKTTGDKPTSVKQQLGMVYGKNAEKYIKNFITDVNGGVTQQPMSGWLNKWISKAKKNAVFASLSVAVQQPSAIARAGIYIDPKYFVGKQPKGIWEEIQKYAPVAIIKDMGYFDMNVGRSAVEWMNHREPEGFKDKLWAFFSLTDSSYRDEVLTWLPSVMDKITWGRIWVATKNEIKDTRKDLDVNSEEFLEAVGERFTYVIDQTQVYDSVFSRSGIMRSKDTGLSVATSFMAEPLTNYNILTKGMIEAKKGKAGKRFAVRSITAYLSSVVLNSLLKSLVQASRDDDEEKSFLEKYIAYVVSNITEDPFSMIPFYSEISSLLQGFDSKRMDTQLFADLVNSVSVTFDPDKSRGDKAKAVAGAFGMATGTGVKNIIRDAGAILRIGGKAKDLIEGKYEPTTGRGILYAILEQYDSPKFKASVPNTAEQAVQAYIDGDIEHYNKQKNNMLEKYGGDEKKVKTQLKTALKDVVQSGDISDADAKKTMKNMLGMNSDDVYFQMKEWKADSKDYRMYDDWHSAVRSGSNLAKTARTYTDNGVKKSTLASQITSEFKDEYVKLYKSGSPSAKTLKNKLLNAYVAVGYDRKEKEKDIDKWVK